LQRNGRVVYLVNIERGHRRRHATFPDTSDGRECARLQAAAWSADINAPPLFPPHGAARVRNKPGSLGAPGLSIWRDPRSGKRYYRFACQRSTCRDWRCFPYLPEGLLEAQAYARQHFRAADPTTAARRLPDDAPQVALMAHGQAQLHAPTARPMYKQK
ncbi:MAG TPA: hypothetical protein VGP82_25235, partial [Ktedonobacterales bacterium]|nr:hypothetical protein [Ktedonobacterales bacterium]